MKGKSRVLVVAPQPFFSPRGTPFSVYYRTLVMAGKGLSIDLLTYGQGEDVSIPGVRILRIPAFRFLGTVRIGPSPLKFFLDGVLFFRMIGALLRRRYRFVHAHEEAVFLALFLKPLFRYRLVYDMHSSLPQQMTNFRFTRSRFWIGLLERLERSALRRSDAVITICPELAEYALAVGVPADRHFLIENSLFDPVKLARAEAEGGDEPPFPVAEDGPLVVYAGTFEAYQGIDLLLGAFARLGGRAPGARLLVVGGAPEQVEETRRAAAALGLGERCAVHGRIPVAAARRLLDSADLVVSPRISGTNTPLKLYELMARGVPLVATRIRSHTQVLDDETAILVDPDPESMAAGIAAALDDGETRERIAAAARERYREHYGREAYEGKIGALLGRVL
ncbi:MAG: glycosyltransferase family 4 protein [Candidatus Eisenbacteria bacterium]|nr:glycosyltransferase family 4 protein [Candidatus Eisenbacteria bacterium]